jgi:hypothetical protein
MRSFEIWFTDKPGEWQQNPKNRRGFASLNLIFGNDFIYLFSNLLIISSTREMLVLFPSSNSCSQLSQDAAAAHSG